MGCGEFRIAVPQPWGEVMAPEPHSGGPGAWGCPWAGCRAEAPGEAGQGD